MKKKEKEQNLGKLPLIGSSGIIVCEQIICGCWLGSFLYGGHELMHTFVCDGGTYWIMFV